MEKPLFHGKPGFAEVVEKLKKEKEKLYEQMQSQANEPETIRYYAAPSNSFSEVGIDIIED